MKNTFVLLRSKGVKVALASAALLSAAGAHAQAASGLPEWASTMFNDIDSAVDASLAVIMPIAAVVIIAFTVLRVAKRGAAKI